MRISDIFGMSFTNLWKRKVRTILTVLGVIIGTASIVVMLSLGLGLRDAMMAETGSAGGLTEIIVSSDMEYGIDELLLDDNTIDNFSKIEHVEKVDPQLVFNMPIQAGKYENYIFLIGATSEYLEKLSLGEGRLPSDKGELEILVGDQVIPDFVDTTTGEYPFWADEEEDDESSVAKLDLMSMPLVAGIEKETAEDGMDSDNETGGYEDPTFSSEGDDFSIDDPFNAGAVGNEDSENDMDTTEAPDFDFMDGFNNDVISYSNFSDSMKRVQIKTCGILKEDSGTYSDFSYNCYTNIDLLKEFLKKNYSVNDVIPGQPIDKKGKPYRDLKYNQLIVKVDKSDNVEAVLERIQSMGYRAEANKEWLEETQRQFIIIEAVLGGIGAVSLLVAAIGIANTMTMSTYERTKEIGIMKVLGCSLGNIRSMFLAEAAFIGLLGGMVGNCLSVLLSLLVNKFLAPVIMSEYYGMEANISVVPPWLIAVSILFSTIIGMVAGFFPAQRATKLSPLAAIRNE